MELRYPDLIEKLADLAKVPVSFLQPISDGYQNSIFEFRVKEKSCVLRVTSAKHRSHAMLQEELRLIDHLASQGQAVSDAVPFRTGVFIEELSQENQTFYVTMFNKAPGRNVKVGDESEWNKDFFKRWGSTVGELHRNTSTITNTQIRRPEWIDFSKEQISFPVNIDVEVLNSYQKLMAEIALLSKNVKVYGLIHNDFHHGNFFVDNRVITLFDFDDSVFGWYANDLAVSIYHAIWNGMSVQPQWTTFSEDFIIEFLDGYFKIVSYQKELVASIPLFLRYRDIFLYQLFLKKWPLENHEPWQKYTLEAILNRIKTSQPIIDFDFTRR